ERFTRHFLGYTLHLVQDLARLNLGDPILDATFTRAHPDFQRLLGDRLVRENPDPNFTATFDTASHSTTRSLNLTGRDVTTSRRFQTIFAKAHLVATLGQTAIATLVDLSEFRALRLQHSCAPYLVLFFLAAFFSAR